MQRIEVNLITGEKTIVDLTQEEIDYILANQPPPFIPTEVTMRQARLALYDAGLLHLVDEIIDNMPIEEQRIKAKIEWEYAATVNRDSNLVYGLAGGFGLSDEMLDDLFVKASKL